MTRCVGGYCVWLAFGDSESLRSSEGHNLRITLHDSRSSEHVVSRGLKFGGQSQRRISFNRPIMATDDSSSSRSSDYAGNNHKVQNFRYVSYVIWFDLISERYKVLASTNISLNASNIKLPN